ncbi:MAG: DUF542 domain-containing protein [Mucilaginibacter sp.]
MELPEIVDVTLIEPGLKHLFIFTKLDELKPGSSLIVHIDHDPKPLYFHLLAERGQRFQWEYLHAGPKEWKVKITKSQVQEAEETIGAIINRDYRKARIFKNAGIDFCCGGKRTVREACELKGANYNNIIAQLSALPPPDSTGLDFQSWDISFLSSYLVQLHHQYLSTYTPFIKEFSQKVAKADGAKHPEIIRVAEIFSDTTKPLELNMMKEERVIFPYLAELGDAYRLGKKIKEADLVKVSNSIFQMETDHSRTIEDFHYIRTITDNYRIPNYTISSYGILYKMLQEYEDDLHLHLHLENNILFPKAQQMENEMRSKKQII